MTTDLEAITCPCFFDGWSQWITTSCPLHDFYRKQDWLGKDETVWLNLIWRLVRASIVILALIQAFDLAQKFL